MQGLHPSGQPGALLSREQFVAPELAELGLDGVQRLDRGLVLGVESQFTRVETGHLGLQGGERAGRPVGALQGLFAGQGQPADLGLGCLGAAAQ